MSFYQVVKNLKHQFRISQHLQKWQSLKSVTTGSILTDVIDNFRPKLHLRRHFQAEPLLNTELTVAKTKAQYESALRGP